MGDPLVAYLRQCCLRVVGERPGCGFFIAPQLIVTCAHVVGRECAIGTVIELQEREASVAAPWQGTLIGLFPSEDIALLQTSTAHAAYAPLSADVRVNHNLTGLGFTAADKFDQFTAIYEGQTEYLGDSGRREVKFKAGQVESGYSGGPLLNLNTGRVVGVVRTTRDKNAPEGGRAVEVPVLERLLQVSDLFLPAIDAQWTDAEARQREGDPLGVNQLTVSQLRALLHQPDTARIEELSRSLGKSQGAIRSALRALGEQADQIEDENLPFKLNESIQKFEEQLKKLAVLQLNDVEVAAKFSQAKTDLEAGNPDAADLSFERAAGLALARARAAEELEEQARVARERDLMEAATAWEQRGQLAMARLAYLKAAQCFEQAANLCPPREAMQVAEYRQLQATALYQQGSEKGDNESLHQAISLYRDQLDTYPREENALDWAMTQNNLGNALRTLGARESGTQRLEEAVAAYRAALQERTRERVPLDWATTQNNLGTALWTLGARESGTQRLEEAKQAIQRAYDLYREAGYEQYTEYFEERLSTLEQLLSSSS